MVCAQCKQETLDPHAFRYWAWVTYYCPQCCPQVITVEKAEVVCGHTHQEVKGERPGER
jgi:hydrogenase maturation factor HypF (carbamoyltransferase family)